MSAINPLNIQPRHCESMEEAVNKTRNRLAALNIRVQGLPTKKKLENEGYLEMMKMKAMHNVAEKGGRTALTFQAIKTRIVAIWNCFQ